jgi:IS5 family transposase
MRRELKRRAAIEATIGHMKTDGRMDRNFLLGRAGDAINALLAAAGHNLRLMLAAWPFGLPSSWPQSQRPSQMRILPSVFSQPNCQ